MLRAREGEALLRGVLDDPGDDLRRLVYADWLEEGGDVERGELIRVQVRLAQMGPLSAYFFTGEPERIEFDGLQAREVQVLVDNGWEWCRGMATFFGDGEPLNYADYGYGGCVGGARWRWRRGFIAEVSCKCAEWERHGRAIMQANPIERVELTDLELWQCADETVEGGCWHYSRGGMGEALGGAYLDGRQAWPRKGVDGTGVLSKQEAIDLLSAVAIRLARGG